jgi:hypothetical protein
MEIQLREMLFDLNELNKQVSYIQVNNEKNTYFYLLLHLLEKRNANLYIHELNFKEK